jgi:hypothetical protein
MDCHAVEELLSGYYDGLLPSKDRRSVAEHLTTCPHCQGRLRQMHRVSALANSLAAREASASLSQKLLAAGLPLQADAFAHSLANVRGKDLPELLRTHLRGDGPVVFPGGEVAPGAWEFGRLDTITPDEADEIIETIMNRARTKLAPVLPRKDTDIVLVCFSRPMHQCGMRLAKTLHQAEQRNVAVVMADDYYRPTLCCSPKELAGQFVVVLVDVVHSGALLNELCEVCLSCAPCHVIGLPVIDQSPERVGITRRYPLWTEVREDRVPLEKFSSENRSRYTSLRFFDPDTGLARTTSELPREIANPKEAQETIERDLRGIRPLLPYIEETSALQPNRWLYGVCYPWVLDLISLLNHSEARVELLRRARECLADLQHPAKKTIIVYPRERHQRAGRWGKDVSMEFGWPVLSVGWKDQPYFRKLTTKQRLRLTHYERVIVVDAAIRTGKTLQSLVNCLRALPQSTCQEIQAFYAINGLFEEQQDELEGRLRIGIRSLFRMPFGSPIDPAGKRWRLRLQQTLKTLPTFATPSEEPEWGRLIREFCNRQLQQLGRPPRQDAPQDVLGNLRRALQVAHEGNRSPLHDIWAQGKRSKVTGLDIEVARRDPSIRNVLHGAVGNHVSPSLRECAALALGVVDDYSWFTKDWMGVQHELLTHGDRPWQFLACIAYWIKQKQEPATTARARQAVEDFRRSMQRGKLFLEPEIESRCGALLTLLTEA